MTHDTHCLTLDSFAQDSERGLAASTCSETLILRRDPPKKDLQNNQGNRCKDQRPSGRSQIVPQRSQEEEEKQQEVKENGEEGEEEGKEEGKEGRFRRRRFRRRSNVNARPVQCCAPHNHAWKKGETGSEESEESSKEGKEN